MCLAVAWEHRDVSCNFSLFCCSLQLLRGVPCPTVLCIPRLSRPARTGNTNECLSCFIELFCFTVPCLDLSLSTSISLSDRDCLLIYRHLRYPVTSGACYHSDMMLRALWADISNLPSRELDSVRCIDRKVCPVSGSGIAECGSRVYINSSQALGRNPFYFGRLGCITPGAKFIDLAPGEVLHGSTVLAIKCVFSTQDFTLNLDSVGERLLADMAGNACCGISFGLALLGSLASSGNRPSFAYIA